MAKEIERLLKSMNEKYDKLSQKQAEYLSMDATNSSSGNPEHVVIIQCS